MPRTHLSYPPEFRQRLRDPHPTHLAAGKLAESRQDVGVDDVMRMSFRGGRAPRRHDPVPAPIRWLKRHAINWLRERRPDPVVEEVPEIHLDLGPVVP